MADHRQTNPLEVLAVHCRSIAEIISRPTFPTPDTITSLILNHMAELERRMDQRFTELETRINSRFDEFNNRDINLKTSFRNANLCRGLLSSRPPLEPLHNIYTGKVITGFPSTQIELSKLDGMTFNLTCKFFI